MKSYKIMLWLSIIPFFFGVFAVVTAKSNLFALLYFAYLLGWAILWAALAYRKNGTIAKRDFWIALAVIIGSIPIQGLVLGLWVFGLK